MAHELAFGTTTPPTRNPHAYDYVAGGSSGGSAAAVAAGMLPLALGTYRVGSVRVPAAFCGVAGMRPRSSLVPTDGVVPLAPALDSVGPLVRRAADMALPLTVISDQPAVDLQRSQEPRIAVLGPEALGQIEAEVAGTVSDAVDDLRRAGAHISEAKNVRLDQPPRTWATRVLAEALEVHRDSDGTQTAPTSMATRFAPSSLSLSDLTIRPYLLHSLVRMRWCGHYMRLFEASTRYRCPLPNCRPIDRPGHRK